MGPVLNDMVKLQSVENQLRAVKTKLSDLGYPMVGEQNSLPKKAKSFVSCAVGRMTK